MRSKRWCAVAGGVALVVAGLATAFWQTREAAPTTDDLAATAVATFVGSERCRSCHAAQTTAWQSSQHAHAMQPADESTVLGDFHDAMFRHGGVTSKFFRRDGRFFVRTDGPNGALADFEVQYTFGVEPLQQYLIELPRGHVQALSIAWDTRSREAGGQRWFNLYPGQRIGHDDELHWTRHAQNWNFMCADCHSTGLHKNYDAATDSYATSWSEMHVGCEACHGPGSQHVAAAGAGGLSARLDERRGVTWTMDAAEGHALRSRSRESAREIEVCAQCHARRAQLVDGYHAGDEFLDHYLPSFVVEPLYWRDGQQRDEVYTYGSFLQSKMQAAGVTCSDCHEPHTQQLRAQGNALCGQCHLASRYDAPSHHFHAAGGEGSACVDCHMPQTTYMVIDPRRDHSLRVPRPDLSVPLGTPNACNACHVTQSAAWAAAAMVRWYPKSTHRASIPWSRPAPEVLRDALLPDIVRASAVARLAAQGPTFATANIAAEAAASASALQRLAATELADIMPVGDRVAVLAPLLADTRRVVRIEAAGASAGIDPAQLPAERKGAWASSSREYVEAQRYNADRPEAHVNLGTFLAQRGDAAGAQIEFDSAIRLYPRFVPAYVNGADMLRAQGRDAEALVLLDRGIAAASDAGAESVAPLFHARGLALVRLQQLDEAVIALRRAHEIVPRDAHYAYVYAVALHSTGDVTGSIRVLQQALMRAPDDAELRSALAAFARPKGGMR